MDKASMRKAYGQALVSLAKRGVDIVVLDADLSKSTGTLAFAREFPSRFFDMGISEADMMGTAAGIASTGKVVFASSFAIFASGRAWEQVRNTIAYSKFNVKIVATHGGITVGEDGSSHQCIEDFALMRVIPGMKVVAPADATTTKLAIFAAAAEEGPIYVRLLRPEVPVVYLDEPMFEIGKGIVVRKGEDVAIVANGVCVSIALEAASLLEEEGISAKVVDLHTIKPLDEGLLLECAEETRGIVVVEEHNIIGGLGSAVAEFLSCVSPTRIIRIGVRDEFGTSGNGFELLSHYGITKERIVLAAKEILNG